jgi:prepilin-type N-terminal cleavage/methylation domain-containing protein
MGTNTSLPPRGFTLVEVLVGIAILLAGFVPVYFLFVSTEKKSIETIRKVQSLTLAHTFLEEIKALPVLQIKTTMGEIEDQKYVEQYGDDNNLKDHFTPLTEKQTQEYARYVEVMEGQSQCRRIKIRVIDKWTEKISDGSRSGTLLEALVLW